MISCLIELFGGLNKMKYGKFPGKVTNINSPPLHFSYAELRRLILAGKIMDGCKKKVAFV